MGLFDDILKKPNPTVGQSSPPSDPLGSGGGTVGGGQSAGSGNSVPLIVKSETSTVFGPESEAEAIRTQNAGPSIPTVHAEEDASSVLVSSPQASSPIAPVAPAPETIVVAPNTDIIQSETPEPLPPPESSKSLPLPSIMTQPPLPNPPAPVEATPSLVTSDALQIPAGPSLFDHIMNDEAPVAPAPVAAPAPAPVAGFQFAAPAAMTETPVAQIPEPAAQARTEVSRETEASNYATPREFIEHSLDNIDVMLKTIDSRHTAKMTEAEGYRMEKMRFAELEKNAYAEAEVMDRERDHTLRMKSIFERELETDEVNRTKKTQTHQESHTEKHVAPHAHTHKRHLHEEEEDAIAAS